MTDGAKIRKYQTHLRISGIAVIVFGLWEFIRLFLFIALNQELLAKIIQDSDVEVSPSAMKIIFYCVCAVISVVDMALRVVIGKNAIKAARGTNAGSAYIYVAIMYLAITIILDISSVIGVEMSDYLVLFSSLAVSLTSSFALLDVIISSFRLRGRARDGEMTVA